MFPKINLLSLSFAFFLFFLPWLDFRCSGESIVTQTGVEIAFGGSTANPDLENPLMSQSDQQEEATKDLKIAPWTAGAFLTVLIGLGLSVTALFGKKRLSLVVPICAGLALVFLITQLVEGFPIEQSISPESKSPSIPSVTSEIKGEEFFSMKKILSSLEIEIVYFPWLFLEFVILAFPICLAFFGWQGRRHP